MAPINVSLTGGTKGPGGKAPGEPRYYNKASGRMETAKAMRGYRAPNTRVSATSRAMGAPRGGGGAAPKARPAAQPKSTPYVHYLGTTFGFPAAKGRGIEGLINAAQNAERGTTVAPYQQKAGEIGNTERTVSNRVGGFNAENLKALGGIMGQQEGSAKTFENNAAESAIKSEKNIETAGQNAITSSGGYLDPALRAQIQASQAEVTGLGQAGTARANELGQNQSQYLARLQAAAVQRGQENQREIGNIYGAERARNTAAENQALGRVEAKAKNERITLPKELRTGELAESKLRQAGELGQEKIGVGIQKNAVTERGQNLTRAGRAETNQTSRANKQEGSQVSRANKQEGSAVSREGHQLTRLSAQERNAITAGKSSARKPMTPAQVLKVEGEMRTAFNAFKKFNPQGVTAAEIRSALPTGSYEGKKEGKLHNFKTGKAWDIFGRAAEEIWYNRRLSPEMKTTFHELGIPEKAWSNELLGAPRPTNPAIEGVRGSARNPARRGGKRK